MTEALIGIAQKYICRVQPLDTHTPEYGGSGKQLNWYQLTEYVHKKHFLLSGGIDIKDIEKISKIELILCYMA